MTAAPVVSQAARDAAAAYHGKVGSPPPAIAFIRGQHSDQDSLVQAFARFEAQSTAPLIEALEQAREALESISEYWNRDRNDMAMHNACWHAINTANDTLAAIAAAGRG